MFTRYSKDVRPSSVEARFFLLVFIVAVLGVISCQNSLAVVISKDFVDWPIPSPGAPGSDDDKGPMVDAIIDVDKHIIIEDLNITVSLTHSAFFDLEIILESPAGTKITLSPFPNYAFIINDNGSKSAGGQNRFLFDDEAAIDIKHAVQPFDQPFRPVPGSELSIFDGKDAFGLWKLKINDLAASHVGQLERVELIISTPEPTTVSIFFLGAFVVHCFKPRKTIR
jgi:hypothetical protein